MSKFNDKNKEIVPEDYFAKFGEKMFEKTLELELFDTADFPILSSIEKNNDFVSPTQYLENFTIANKAPKSKSRAIYYAIGIAASLLLAVFLFTMSEKNSPIIEKVEIASIEDLDYYLDEENIDNIDLIDIIELQEILYDDKKDGLVIDNIDDELLIDYLLDESDSYDLSLIY